MNQTIQLTPVRRLTMCAACIALCVVLPMAFHAIPNAGQVMLPMHIPVLLCGMLCGAPLGAVCGLLGPFLSHTITGMPLAPALPAMMAECASYGLIVALMLGKVGTGRVYRDIYIAQSSAMLLGRIVSGIFKALTMKAGQYSFSAWLTASFLTGLPGIAVQLVLLPLLVRSLMRAQVIPERY